MFEGRGGDIRNNFYTKYTPKQFKQTFFIVSSNSLPEMANDYQRDTDTHKHQWLPLESRVDIVMLEESFAGKTKEFVYDAPTLATALKALID